MLQDKENGSLEDKGKDIYFLQEVKKDDKQVKDVMDAARANGYRAFMAPCTQGAGGRPSAGVAILARAYLDISYDLIKMNNIIIPHRALAVPMRVKHLGVCVLYSVYLKTSCGMNSFNCDIMKAICEHSLCHGKPIIMGGDWNNPPDVIANLLQGLKMKVTVMHPDQPTFCQGGAQTCIDFFIVDNRLLHLMGKPEVMPLVAIQPHQPVDMSFDCKGADVKVPRIKKPPTIPVEKPFGPVPPPQDWSGNMGDVKTLYDSLMAKDTCPASGSVEATAAMEQLNTLLPSWFDLANQEMADITGTTKKVDLMGREVVIIQDTLSSTLAKDKKYRPLPSRTLQWLAGRLQQIVSLICKANNSSPQHQGPAYRKIDYLAQGIHHMIAGRRFKHKELTDCLLIDQAKNNLSSLQHSMASGMPVDDQVAPIRQVATALMKEAASMRNKESAHNTATWTAYAEDAIVGHATEAFNFIKLQPPLDPVAVAHSDGHDTVDPIALLEAKVCDLDKAWKAGKAGDAFVPADDDIPLPKAFTAHDVERAGKSFKKRTARADGWHPRFFGMLSVGARTTIAMLLTICEIVGDLPKGLADLQMPLIKQEADLVRHKRRPVGLYRGLVRLWGRMTRPLVQQWAETHCADPFFTNSKGRKVTDTSWRTASRSSLATDKGDKTLDVQADLQSCFEHVDRELLWGKAKGSLYPLSTLRLSLASYAWPRRVLLDGIASRVFFAIKGIVAGSSHATTELKLYVQEDFRTIVAKHKNIIINIHVDDIILSGINRSANVLIETMYNAFADIIYSVQEVLNMIFSPKKTFVLGNDSNVVKRTAKVLGRYAGSTVAEVQRLGVNYTAGKRATNRGRNVRVAKALRRKAKILQITRSIHRPEKRLFYAGCLPCADYGVEVTGMPKTWNKKLTSMAGMTMKLGKALRHNPVAWAIMRKKGTVDPTILNTVAPATRYAQEWWAATNKSLHTKDTLSPQELVRCFNNAEEQLDSHRWTHLRFAHNPIALAIKGIESAGYQCISPVEFTKGGGEVHNLTLGPPCLFQKYLVEGMEDIKVKDYITTVVDRHSSWKGAEAIKEKGIWLEPLKKLYNARKSTVNFKRCLINFVCDNVITGTVLKTRGYKTTGICPFCGCPDTVTHRVFTCTKFNDERASLVPRWLMALFVKDGPNSFFFQRGWATEPEKFCTSPIPDEVVYSYFLDGEPVSGPLFFNTRCRVYGDGSAIRALFLSVARAGFAVASFHNDGAPHIVVTGNVPRSMPQTASSAERLAVFSANSHTKCDDGIDYTGDCTSAFTILDPKSISFKSPWAGLAKELQSGKVSVKSTSWIKSHQVADEHKSPDEAFDINCNGFVDQRARDSIIPFDVHDSDVKHHDRSFTQLTGLLRATASMLALWPGSKELYGDLPIPPGQCNSSRKAKNQHNYVWRGKFWQCTTCFVRRHKVDVWAKQATCKPVPSVITNIFRDPHGHVLMLTMDHAGKHTAFCSVCGVHSSVISKGLSRDCHGRNHGDKNVNYSLSCFYGVQPKHPRTGERLSDPVPAYVVLADMDAAFNMLDPDHLDVSDVEMQNAAAASSIFTSLDQSEMDFVPGDLIEDNADELSDGDFCSGWDLPLT